MTERDHEFLEAINELNDSINELNDTIGGSQEKVIISVDKFVDLNNRIIDLEKRNDYLESDNDSLKWRIKYFTEKLGITYNIFNNIFGLEVSTCTNECDQTVNYCIKFKIDSEKCKSI